MANLGRNIVANYVGRGWASVLSILLIPVYLRFMGIEAYGLVGFYMALSSVLGILDLGIGATMTRELARLSAKKGSAGEQRDLVRTLEVIYWGIAIFAGGVVILIAPYISGTWIKSQNLSPVTILRAVQFMGFAIAFQFPISLYQGGLMGLQRQVLVNGILILTGTLRSVGAILVLWLVSPTIEAFMAWQVVSSIIGSGIFFATMWRSLPKHTQQARFRGPILHGIWKYSAAISANAIIGIVLTQIDKVILSRMLTLKMFAYYSLAATVASAIWMIIIPFNTAVFPRFVQLHEKERSQELCVLFHRSSQILSFFLLPFCALLIVFSSEILFLWMHDPSVVENCHLIISLLVFGTMLNGIVSIPTYCASAFGWPLLITYTNLIQAVFIIPLIIVLVYWLHGAGAAIAWIILNSTFVLFMVPVFFRRYFRDELGKWYLGDVAAPAIAAFLICLLSLFLVPVIHSSGAIWGRLIVTGVLATIAAGATLPYIRDSFYLWCQSL